MRIDTGAPEAVSKIEQKLVSAVERHRMIPEGAYVVAGVSGGADSMALLHFLSRIEGIRLLAAHVNHGLRGAEADRDEGFVRDWCAAHGIALEILHADVARLAREQKQGIEECGRAVRYHFFEKLAGTDGRIATAHTLSDSVETVIYHLATWTAAAGLCGIPPVRGNIIRPLILLTGKQTRDYCKTHGVAYVVDSSNQEDTYTRNRLRHYVVPVLAQINPEFEQAAMAFADQLRSLDQYMEKQAKQALLQARTDGGYQVQALSQLETPVLTKAVALSAEEKGCRCLERVHIDTLVGIIRSGQGALDLPGGLRAVVKQGVYRLVLQKNGEENWEISVIQAKVLTKYNKKIILTVSTKAEFDQKLKFNKKLLNNALDCAIISDSSVFRNRREKDHFSPAGRGVGKSVKKLFNESRVLQEQRSRVILLANGSEVLWIDGFGTAQQARVHADTKQVLLLEVQDACI